MICSAVCLVHFMVESPAQSGRMRTLIHPGPISGVHVNAACTVANPELAALRLGWRTQRSLNEICRDGWAWQQANPQGYGNG